MRSMDLLAMSAARDLEMQSWHMVEQWARQERGRMCGATNRLEGTSFAQISHVFSRESVVWMVERESREWRNRRSMFLLGFG